MLLISDLDYESIAIDLTIGPSETDTTNCENIQLLSDTVIEGTEVFSVQISSTDLNVNILTQSASIVIQDESTVDIEFARSVYSVREDEGTLQVCAELSGGTLQRNIEVELTTQDSTALGMFCQTSMAFTIVLLNPSLFPL